MMLLPHDPLIAEPLFLTRYIEKVGTGTLDMIARSREAGLAPPSFVQEQGQVKQVLWRPAVQVTVQVTDQVEALRDSLLQELAAALDLPTAQVTAQVGSILQSMVGGERSRDELMQAAELAHREHFRKFYLNPLMLAGWLVRTMPDPNSRLQRYRITEKGQAWLDRFNTLPKP